MSSLPANSFWNKRGDKLAEIFCLCASINKLLIRLDQVISLLFINAISSSAFPSFVSKYCVNNLNAKVYIACAIKMILIPFVAVFIIAAVNVPQNIAILMIIMLNSRFWCPGQILKNLILFRQVVYTRQSNTKYILAYIRFLLKRNLICKNQTYHNAIDNYQ